MTLSPTALEAAAKAVEQDLSRDIAAWVERYTGPHGCDDDAPEPPKGNYRSTPARLATAAITAYLAQAGKEGWVMVPRTLSNAEVNLALGRDADAYLTPMHSMFRDFHNNVVRAAAAQNGGEPCK